MGVQRDVRPRTLILTALLVFAVFNMGCFYGLLGPSLPDLQRLTNTSLQGVSLLFTIVAVGRAVGGVLLGHLYDRTQRFLLIMAGLTGGAAVSISCLPWTQVYGVFLTVSSVCGFCLTGVMIGSTTKVISLWGSESRRYTQLVFFLYSLGGVVSPLAASPFFAKSYTAIYNITASPNTTDSLGSEEVKTNAEGLSGTETYLHISSAQITNTSNATKPIPVSYGDTHISVPFAITGGLFLLSCLSFIMIGCLNLPSNESSAAKKDLETNSVNKNNETQMTRNVTVLLVIIFVLLKYVVSSIELVQHAYLMTFVLRELRWTRFLGAALTSALWASVGLGRFMGILIAKCLSPSQMIYLSLCSALLTCGGQFAAGFYNIRSLTWIFVPLSGLCISLFSPTLLVWVNENLVKVTGKVSSLFSFFNAMAMMTSPLYVAFLMDTQTAMCYVYVQGLESAVAVILFSFLVLGVRYRTDPERKPLLSQASIQ